MTDAASSYEELPYTRNPFHTTHPDCLATVAFLHGLEPPSSTRCRVLELGCASGGNLIPMAAGLPDSTFVGIDLSPRQISQGQELIDAVGLKNIELRPLSIMDVERRLRLVRLHSLPRCLFVGAGRGTGSHPGNLP